MRRFLCLVLLLSCSLAAQEQELNPRTCPIVSQNREASLDGLLVLPSDTPRLTSSPRSPSFSSRDLLPFLGGALAGLAIHEAGHYTLNLALGTDPYLKRVETAGIPFFAISHRKEVSPRQEYAIATAGFWAQHAMSEAILRKYPHLWRDAPMAVKGAFTFHLATSLVYAYAALAKSGPPERDTLAMARGLGLDERWIGLALLIPAALDLYRSLCPGTPWATWSSRGFKVGFVFALTK